MRLVNYIVLLLIVNYQLSIAQDIPVGTWRAHISFNDIHTIALAPDRVFAAASAGVMIVDQTDRSITTITPMDGLSSTNITYLAFDPQRNQLLITYADGDVDIIRDNEIINFNTLKNSTTIPGSKRINHIALHQNLAYLSADFGVVMFDLVQLAVKETWRDLGVGGSGMRINQSTIYNDSIFLATQYGVLAGDLTDNLLDFNNWKRFSTGAFNTDIKTLTAFNEHIYAAVNGSGIYEYTDGTWTLKPYLQNLQYKNLTAGGSLKITLGTNLYTISSTDVVTTIISDKIQNPYLAIEDATNKLWIADAENGLVSNVTNSFERYTANGPTFSGGLRLRYDRGSNTTAALSGGFNTSMLPWGVSEHLNLFSVGNWKSETTWLDKDLTDITFAGNKTYLASYGYGVQVIDGATSVLYDESNSPLVNVSAGRNVRISALAVSTEGVWVTNVGATQSLHLLKNDNTWQSFSFPLVAAARYPTALAVDYSGNVWMVLNPTSGGGVLVFNPATDQSVYLTDANGAGALPSRSVYSIAMDRDGFMWLGTAAGVAYFPDPSRVFSGSVTAVKPVFENRYLLRDERVTAIEVDGGNRKWMSSDNGVWLFNPYGEEQIYNFNTTNSPLPSNKIVDLELNSQSGELFMMTDAGIISYRSDATLGTSSFQQVKIFPNPVTADYNGHVGISGLTTDAIVKITDVAGKLVWQTKANGGAAAWNVRDYTGRRPATGMYLVFCIAQNGTESLVGKIAVVN